jgi:hypothetical protein
MRQAVAVLASLLALLTASPALSVILPDAGPAKDGLRYVANISRLAVDPQAGRTTLGPECVEPFDSTFQQWPWELVPPPAGYLSGGTPNMKILARVWHYGWALRTRSPNLPTIRATLLDFVNRQQQQTGSGGPLGHYATSAGASEELTSSHYQLWAGAMSAAYLYALANGGTLTTNSETTTPETAVRDAVRKWWADEQKLYDYVYTDAKLDAPGARFESSNPTGGPLITNPLRDDIYRLLKGEAPQHARSCSSDRYYTGSFVMQKLRDKGVPRLGQPPAGHVVSAKLADTLCVYRMGSDWTLYFPVMRGVTGALYWVELRNNVIKRARVPYDGAKPTSYPPNMAWLDPPGGIPGVVAGAAECPQPHVLGQ